MKPMLKFDVLLICFLTASRAVAECPKSPSAGNLPSGLKVAGAGNSWYSENGEPLCKAADR